MTEREPPELRDHETYEGDHWDVVDITDVDKVFATGRGSDGGIPEVRIDLDGEHAGSALSTVGPAGGNVNASIWLGLPEAVTLCDHLLEAIQRARERSQDQDRADPGDSSDS